MAFQIRRFDDPAAFLRHARAWLLLDEAENNLILGLAERLVHTMAGLEPPFYLAAVEEDGAVVGCAFRTPPFKLVLTRLPEAAVAALVEDVASAYAALPAVIGPEAGAHRFAGLWAGRTGAAVREGMRQRLYRLDTLIEPRRLPPGAPRPAMADDLERVAGWIAGFQREAGIRSAEARSLAEERIAAGAVLLWEDGEPRSMAASVGRTPGGERIGYVYTPPEWRGRGYAAACTAALTRRILDAGRSCFLYTDLANPTSNAIYQRLGYRPVCDAVDLLFEA